MWIFALEGFVSIVAVRGRTDRLMIRGRLQEDVEHWRDLVGEGELKHTSNADYAWRFTARRMAVAKALAQLARKVSYDNFKGAVGHTNPERARAYMAVWAAMRQLQS